MIEERHVECGVPDRGLEVVYYRRMLGHATDIPRPIVYAVFPSAPVPALGVVATVGGFPVGVRPTELPGHVIVDHRSTLQYWTSDVPVDQLRLYTPLLESEAFALYPRLGEFVDLARHSLVETGELPPGIEG